MDFAHNNKTYQQEDDMYIFDDELDFDELTEDEINELTERALDWIDGYSEYQVQQIESKINSNKNR